MPETQDQTSPSPRDQGAAFLASYDELAAQAEMLAIDNRAVHEQFTVVVAENERLRAELARVTGQAKTYADDLGKLKRILASAGNSIAAGLATVQSGRALRGVPSRNDEPMPSVVRAGPRSV